MIGMLFLKEPEMEYLVTILLKHGNFESNLAHKITLTS